VAEKAPEIYKPREGKVNGNLAKFKAEHLSYMHKYAGDIIGKLGYSHLFNNASPDVSFLLKFNQENLVKSIKCLNDSEVVTSIMVNYPALLLRKKS